MQSEPDAGLVTVIMPVRNEAVNIRQTLSAVLNQTCSAAIEVVVADGMSTDGTRDILASVARSDPRVRWVDNPSGRTADALNIAISAARGAYLARVDAHSHVANDYIQRLVDHLTSGECDGVGGQKRAVGRGPFGRAVAAAHASRFGIGNSKYHYATRPQHTDHVPFGAYLTARVRAIGGYDRVFIRNQDYEFDFRYRRSGGRLLLDPAIVVDWYVREGPQALAKQYFQYGYWRFRTLRKHPSSFSVRWLAPPGVVGIMLAAVFGSVLGPLPWPVPGLLAVVYLAVLGAGALTLVGRTGWRLTCHTVLALAIMHLAWGSGFWCSVIYSGLTFPLRAVRD
jgi:succinoglycan biosynthesis protein ExoA